MVQTAARPVPLVDDVTVKDLFADTCVGAIFTNGNVHMTFASDTGSHVRDPAPLSRVVSCRLVMPISGVVDFRDTLNRVIDYLIRQGAIAPISPTIAGTSP